MSGCKATQTRTTCCVLVEGDSRLSAKKRVGGRSGECANVQSGRRHPATDALSRRLAASEQLDSSDGREGVHSVAGGSSDPMRSRARGDERCVCCEAGEGHIHLANVEGATAVVMQYGYQRGEYFEGCEQALIGKSRVVPGSSDSGHTRWKFSESCPVLGRNKPRTSSELKPSRW